MASLTDLGDIAAQLTTSGRSDQLFFYVDNRDGSGAATAPVAGRWSSLWTWNKTPGGQGAAPGAVAVPTNATNGCLFQANAGGGREKWLLGWSGIVAQGTFGAFMLYDRLLHISGLSGTSTSPQTVGGTLTRNTGGVGNQIWAEVYTIIGTTGTTITASYTNQSGTSGRTTKPAQIGATGLREVSRMVCMPLQDGDTGVQAVASVTLAGTTGTAGNFGVTVLRPIDIAAVTSQAGGFQRDFIAGYPTVPQIVDNACLALAFLSNSTSAPQLHGHLSMVEK